MTYPYGYPDHRLIVDDVDLSTEFQLILVDGYELNPPQPKFYTVDIPGGNGVIDLTEALGGDVAYSNRKQRFTFKCIYDKMFESTKTKVSNFLHGKHFEYKLSWDVEYVYRGRFSVISYSHFGLAAGILGEIVIEVDADPYKYKETRTYGINGVGGELFHFASGRKPVRPIVQTSRPTIITWKGETTVVGIGTFRLNDVLFTEGVNELYVNTYEIYYSKWQDFGNGGSHKMTWEQASDYNWDQFQRIGLPVQGPESYAIVAAMENSSENEIMPLATTGNPPETMGTGEGTGVRTTFFAKAYRWNDLRNFTWDYLKNNGWTWDGVNYNPNPGVGTNDGTNKPPSTGGSNTGNQGGSIPSTSDTTKVTDFSKLDFNSTSMYITYEWGDL